MRTQIIYEDKDLLVCCKPAGLAVQSGRASEPDMVSELKNYLAKKEREDGGALRGRDSGLRRRPPEKDGIYLGVIHRLDQPVSGILVFAKNQPAAADLSRQVSERLMKKTYRAVVMLREDSNPKPPAEEKKGMQDEICAQGPGTELTDYMVKEAGGMARIADPKEKDAKKAKLSYRCLERRDVRALMEIELETGRHHQIRVQMAHAGMPLLGDARYGSRESRELSERMGIRTVQLQAVKLCFRHPSTGKRVCYELEKKLEL